MPDHAHVTVAAEQAPEVLDALLSLYGARADALAEAAGRTDEARLRDARSALMDADAALDTFGWERGARLEAAELTGSARLVGEVLAAAVTDAAESFDSTLDAYAGGRAGLPEVEAAHGRLSALLALFLAHEADAQV
jgi:hypothetical protein